MSAWGAQAAAGAFQGSLGRWLRQAGKAVATMLHDPAQIRGTLGSIALARFTSQLVAPQAAPG